MEVLRSHWKSEIGFLTQGLLTIDCPDLLIDPHVIILDLNIGAVHGQDRRACFQAASMHDEVEDEGEVHPKMWPASYIPPAHSLSAPSAVWQLGSGRGGGWERLCFVGDDHYLGLNCSARAPPPI